MRKPTKIGQLTELPEDQQQLLVQWLDSPTPYHEIVDRVQTQFGVTTNKTQLGRYRDGRLIDNVRGESIEDRAVIAKLMDDEALGKTEYKPAAMKLVEKRAFRLALNSDTDTRQLTDLFGIFYRADRAETDKQRVEVAKERNRIARENLELKKLKFQMETVPPTRNDLPS